MIPNIYLYRRTVRRVQELKGRLAVIQKDMRIQADPFLARAIPDALITLIADLEEEMAQFRETQQGRTARGQGGSPRGLAEGDW